MIFACCNLFQNDLYDRTISLLKIFGNNINENVDKIYIVPFNSEYDYAAQRVGLSRVLTSRTRPATGLGNRSRVSPFDPFDPVDFFCQL